MSHHWRPMTQSDVADVIAMAAVVHPGYPEDDAVLAGRLQAFAAGCHILEKDNLAAGYLLSHPWVHGDPPKLNTLITSIPDTADCYYLHDIALLPSAQGSGAAKAAVGLVDELAQSAGFSRISLCAVNGSAPFWAARGFVPDPDPKLEARLASYGSDVRFMTRML